MGKDSNPLHKVVVRSCDDLMNQFHHIEKLIEKHTIEHIIANRLRLKVSVNVIRWLTFQGCAFRGHDGSVDSSNHGNFIEMIKLLATCN